MSQGGAAVWLAVRELWISFRLLVLLTAFVGSGVAVALLPAPPREALARLGLGLGMATAITAAVAAWSLAEDRVRGRAAWLVTRSVPRAALVAAWFLGIGLVILPAIGAAAVLGWLASAPPSAATDPLPFAVTLGGVAATALAATALGLLLGAIAPPLPAGALAGVVAAAAFLLPLALPSGAPAIVPAAALVAGGGVTPWVGLGAGLVATALLLAAARLALEQVDL